jgi:hypothetical protein
MVGIIAFARNQRTWPEAMTVVSSSGKWRFHPRGIGGHPAGRSAAHFFQRRAFVHGDVIGLIALDFVLRIIRAGVVRVALVIDVLGMHLDDPAADAPGLRVPGHVVADFELSWHDGSPRIRFTIS